MSKELVERLRTICHHDSFSVAGCCTCESADHIEQLEREVFALKTPCAVALVALEDFNEQSKRQGIFLPAEIDFAIDRLREALAKGRKP